MANTSKNPAGAIDHQENDGELRAWFELLLELQARGFTSDQVREALLNQNPVRKKSTAEAVNEFETCKPVGANKSWCW
jgi:hypothetical protein